MVQILDRPRPIGAQIGEDHMTGRVLRIGNAGPFRAGEVRPHECGAVSVAGSEAQVTLPCQWLEERAPAGAQLRAEVAQSRLGKDR